MIDLRRLHVLRAVDHYGTVTAAAAALHLTTSAASQQIRQLGRELDVTLLEPLGRTVRLTDAARTLLAHADAMEVHWQHARAELDATQGGPTGTLRMAAFPTAMCRLLGPVAASLRARHPSLTVRLRVPTSSPPAPRPGSAPRSPTRPATRAWSPLWSTSDSASRSTPGSRNSRPDSTCDASRRATTHPPGRSSPARAAADAEPRTSPRPWPRWRTGPRRPRPPRARPASAALARTRPPGSASVRAGNRATGRRRPRGPERRPRGSERSTRGPESGHAGRARLVRRTRGGRSSARGPGRRRSPRCACPSAPRAARRRPARSSAGPRRCGTR
ncbi:LysR substrate binding domain-containing protein [Prauserella aidingensis]|nr:LysR substrate binding domain-containing protein [Prauserella aidingensis]